MMRVRNGTDPGSSPLTRGKRAALDLLDCLQGLIPAHAGKTPSIPRPRLSQGAHPRSRGENDPFSMASAARLGSSPLTRGKRSSARRGNSSGGLIPAHAGKTSGHDLQPAQLRAHPRSRGENSRGADRPRSRRGSSPLTRGKLGAHAGSGQVSGLIPAHAGKTRSRGCLGRSAWAHPRSRGENSSDATPAKDSVGSSPLTRGKHLNPRRAQAKAGLIPAHAGKTQAGTYRGMGGGAHPRSRGENSVFWTPPPSQTGSSPLTRGKLGLATHAQVPAGLIPAHAGKTHRTKSS